MVPYDKAKKLNLRGQQLSDDAVINIIKKNEFNREITHVDLSGNCITDKGIRFIADTIQKFWLPWTHLNLKGNFFGKEGAIAIAKALRNNKKIKYLNLAENVILDKGAEAIARAIQFNRTLKYLNLRECRVSSKGLNTIESIINENNKNQITLILGSRDVASRRNIFEDIDLNSACWDFSDNSFDDNVVVKIAQEIENNKKITDLNFTNNFITSKGARDILVALSSNKAITRLNFKENNIKNDNNFADLLASFLKSHSLTYLNFADNIISDEGATAICEAMRNGSDLKYLNLQDNDIREDKIISMVSQISQDQQCQFSHLSLGGNFISDRGAIAIASLLKSNNTIMHLDLRRCAIADKGAIAIANALKFNNTLTHLNLQGCAITDEGAKAITDVIKFHNTTLKNLNLVNNLLSREKRADEPGVVSCQIPTAPSNKISCVKQPQLWNHTRYDEIAERDDSLMNREQRMTTPTPKRRSFNNFCLNSIVWLSFITFSSIKNMFLKISSYFRFSVLFSSARINLYTKEVTEDKSSQMILTKLNKVNQPSPSLTFLPSTDSVAYSTCDEPEEQCSHNKLANVKKNRLTLSG